MDDVPQVRSTMRHVETTSWPSILALCAILSCGACTESLGNGRVSGTVRMPDVCTPAVSPAVVYLARTGEKQKTPGRASGEIAPADTRAQEVALVNQRGLQFVPRIQAIAVGQTIRFTNDDGETHNVHVVSPEFVFNQSMSPGQFRDFSPSRPGVMKLACDIHMHMRAFVVISPSPWVQVCDREGRYRLEGVPEGRYTLTAWHEMGDPVHREITVTTAQQTQLPDLVLTSTVALGRSTATQKSAPVRPWADVIDEIGVTLAASRDAATRPGEAAKARRLADDAYWVGFESSDMEIAVNKYLGFGQARKLERQFHAISVAARNVAEKRQPVSAMAELCHQMLLDLTSIATILSAKGVTDRSRIDTVAGLMQSPSQTVTIAADLAALNGPGNDPRALLEQLRNGLSRVTELADRNDADGAASELSSVYMTEFEPLERYLLGRSPQSVRPLEIEFNSLRGDLTAGLRGEKLSARVEALRSAAESEIGRLETRPVGSFGPAFFSSLITILREGIEVILVVTMLLALVAKAAVVPGQTNAREPEGSHGTKAGATRASRAIWWGVGLAAVASVATAAILNVMLISASGAVREILEGVVMLVAAAILYYVSYWLVSQLEAKRWMDFLKKQARHGLELGGQGTLAATAFLAVYREGAETSLMYQALLGSEGRTESGFLGLTAGLAVGIVILAVIAYLIRATSVRLPMRMFFQLSGLFLFALAIVFAGNGVFELQNAGILLTTNLAWLGHGLPWVGLYPNLQVVSVQGLLLAGAILAWLVIPRAALQPATPVAAGVGLATKGR
jgi:high-affinity iron transporter